MILSSEIPLPASAEAQNDVRNKNIPSRVVVFKV